MFIIFKIEDGWFFIEYKICGFEFFGGKGELGEINLDVVKCEFMEEMGVISDEFYFVVDYLVELEEWMFIKWVYVVDVIFIELLDDYFEIKGFVII